MLRRFVLAMVTLSGLMSAALQAQPGLTSVARTVTLSATRSSSLTVNVASGGTQTLASITDNALNPFPTPVRIIASWAVAPGTSEVRMLAYFGNAAQALANGTTYLASSRIQGRVQTSPTTLWQPVNWTAFTQNANRGVGVNGASLRLMRVPITNANLQASRTIDLDLRLNLVGQPALTSGTYSGTVTVRAFTT